MSKEIKVGLLAILAVIVLFWGYNYIKGINVLDKGHTYYVDYSNIYGLEESNQVVWRGMVIGLVESVDPTFGEEVTIRVTLNIKEDLRIPDGTKATIISDGIMGGKLIRLDFDDVCHNDCLESGSFLVPNNEGLLASFATEDEIGNYLEVIKSGAGDIADSLNSGLLDEDTEIGRMVSDMRVTLSYLRGSTAALNRLLEQSSSNLNAILENMDAITRMAAEEKESLRHAIHNVESLTANLAKTRIDSTVFVAQETLEQTTKSMRELNLLLNQINEGQGSMGKLMKDEELYNSLTEVLRETDLLLQDFRLNPKRYVNVSVFGKKQKKYALPDIDPADTLR